MLDNRTRSIYGWKIEGRDKVNKFFKAIEKINKNYYDDYIDFLVNDGMCGEYIYFGANLVNYDANEGGEVVLHGDLITKAVGNYHKFLKEHQELDEFLKKQIGKTTTFKDPHVFVFQQIW